MGVLTELAALLGDIFKIISDSVHECVDAKLKAFKRHVAMVLFAAIWVFAGTLMAIVGLTFVTWGVYSLLAEAIKPGAAAIVTGTGVFLLAAIFTAMAKSRSS